MRKFNNELKEVILEEIKKNDRVTEKELAELTGYHERTIRRYIYFFKKDDILTMENCGRSKKWLLKK